MNKTSIFAIATVLTLVVAATANSAVSIAFADPPGEDGKRGGPNDEKNQGQCKQLFMTMFAKKHNGS